MKKVRALLLARLMTWIIRMSEVNGKKRSQTRRISQFLQIFVFS